MSVSSNSLSLEVVMRNPSIRIKIILCVALVLLFAGGIISWISIKQHKASISESAEKHALDLAEGYFDLLNTMMLTGVIANRDIARQKLLEHPEILAVRTIRGEPLNAQYPNPSLDSQPKDALDREALTRGEIITDLRQDETGRVLTILKPAIANNQIRHNMPACVNCHRVEPGAVLGAVRLEFSLAERDAAEIQNQVHLIGWNVGLFFFGLVVIFVLLNRMVILPIQDMKVIIRQVEVGDLTHTLKITSGDELGQAGMGINSIVSNLRANIHSIQSKSRQLSHSSGSLSKVAHQMAVGAKEAEAQAGQAFATTEDLNLNIQNIADSAQDITYRVQEIAKSTQHVAQNMDKAHLVTQKTEKYIFSLDTASNEMSATMNQIAEDTEHTKRETYKAVGSVEKAARLMSDLAKSSNEIDHVIAAIEEIAELTSTLALNATIEAARAGAAGMGFAVVADQVRALAQQTNQATHEIKERVQAIRDTTQITVDEMQCIEEVIHKVNGMVDEISVRVEKQNVKTSENQKSLSQILEGMNEVSKRVGHTHEELELISSNVMDVATKTNAVSENTSEAAKKSQGVVRNISVLKDESSNGAGRASDVNHSAEGLTLIASHLNDVVSSFKV